MSKISTTEQDPHRPKLSSADQSTFDKALQQAMESDDLDMINLALQQGAEPNILLLAGVKESKLPWVTCAVEHGGDVNMTDTSYVESNWGSSGTLVTTNRIVPLLHLAAKNYRTGFIVKHNHPEIMDYLLAKGADIEAPFQFVKGNEQPENFGSVLYRAVCDSRYHLCVYLLEKGAAAHPANHQQTPLTMVENNSYFYGEEKKNLLKLMLQKISPQKNHVQAFNAESVKLDAPVEIMSPVHAHTRKNAQPPSGGPKTGV